MLVRHKGNEYILKKGSHIHDLILTSAPCKSTKGFLIVDTKCVCGSSTIGSCVHEILRGRITRCRLCGLRLKKANRLPLYVYTKPYGKGYFVKYGNVFVNNGYVATVSSIEEAKELVMSTYKDYFKGKNRDILEYHLKLRGYKEYFKDKE